jgi:hypothetical protein
MNYIVTHRLTAGQRPQHALGQQCRGSVFCSLVVDRCYAAPVRHVHECAVTSQSNRRRNVDWCSLQIRAEAYVFCDALSVPGLYK